MKNTRGNKNQRILAGCMLACFVLTVRCEPAAASAYSRSHENLTLLNGPSTYSSTASLKNHSDEAETAPQIKYTIEEDKVEYKDKNGIVRGLVSFSYPQFRSSSPALIKINNQLKNKSKKYFLSGNAATIKETTQYSIDNHRFYDKHEQYYWTTQCSVSYDDNGIISFHMNEQWYAGGVHNVDNYGLNYDLTTGKTLSINDVISGNARKKILKAGKAYCKDDMTAYAHIKQTKKFKFYLYKGDVYICFGSYELAHGTSWDEFTVKGSYD